MSLWLQKGSIRAQARRQFPAEVFGLNSSEKFIPTSGASASDIVHALPVRDGRVCVVERLAVFLAVPFKVGYMTVGESAGFKNFLIGMYNCSDH